MDAFFNLGFPLLSKEMPRLLNSIAIWIVIIDAVCDFARYSSNGFKLRKYYNEDGYIAMALDISVLFLVGNLILGFFNIKLFDGLYIFSLNIVFLIVVCAIANAVLLNMSKFDYSRIITDENKYDKIMSDFRSKRRIGSLTLIISSVSLRILMALYPTKIPLVTMVVLIVIVITRLQFTHISTEMRKYLNKCANASKSEATV